MKETKIKGLKIKMFPEKIEIKDYYQIQNIGKIEYIIKKIFEKEDDLFIYTIQGRKIINLFIKKWITCNRLRKILFLKKRKNTLFFSKDKYSKISEIFYNIFGFYKSKGDLNATRNW